MMRNSSPEICGGEGFLKGFFQSFVVGEGKNNRHLFFGNFWLVFSKWRGPGLYQEELLLDSF